MTFLKACVSVSTMVLPWALCEVYLSGCSATHATADAVYTAQQLDCVQKAQTLAESKECRAKVDAKWGLDASVPGDAK